jgi:hypothetical protein
MYVWDCVTKYMRFQSHRNMNVLDPHTHTKTTKKKKKKKRKPTMLA